MKYTQIKTDCDFNTHQEYDASSGLGVSKCLLPRSRATSLDVQYEVVTRAQDYIKAQAGVRTTSLSKHGYSFGPSSSDVTAG